MSTQADADAAKAAHKAELDADGVSFNAKIDALVSPPAPSPGESASGTYSPPAASLQDAKGNLYTLGKITNTQNWHQILMNGQPLVPAGEATTIAYSNKQLFAQNAVWYVLTSQGTWAQSAAPPRTN